MVNKVMVLIFSSIFNSEEWEKVYQISIKSKTTEENSVVISFPKILYESIFQSGFVIS